MSAATLGCLVLVAFFTLELLGPSMKKGVRRALLVVFALALGVGACEYARFDHGRADWVLWLGFVGAPVAVIFGGAAAGARRWYGWPDLGPIPGRLAAVAAVLLLGVMVGTQIKESDVRETIDRGEVLRRRVRAWRDAHEGRWPAALSDAAPDAPTTRMGGFAPPPFAYDAAKHELSFPLNADVEIRNDLAASVSAWERVRR